MESHQELKKLFDRLPKERSLYLNNLFKNCPDTVIRRIVHTQVPAQHFLLRAGESCTRVVIVLTGRANGIDNLLPGNFYVFTDYSGVEILGDYELFGDISKYRISIQTQTPCDILIIPSQPYLDWVSRDVNALFLRIKAIMRATVREGPNERKYQFLECRDRMVLYLADLYEKYGGQGEFTLQKKQPELAEMLGFHVRTIQRNIQLLESEGMIASVAGRIRITQEQYLKIKERAGEISGLPEDG